MKIQVQVLSIAAVVVVVLSVLDVVNVVNGFVLQPQRQATAQRRVASYPTTPSFTSSISITKIRGSQVEEDVTSNAVNGDASEGGKKRSSFFRRVFKRTTNGSNEQEEEDVMPAVLETSATDVDDVVEESEPPTKKFKKLIDETPPMIKVDDYEPSTGRISQISTGIDFNKVDSPSANKLFTYNSPSEDLSALKLFEVPNEIEDRKIVHLTGLIIGTLWWYIFSGYEFITNPREIFGLDGSSPLYYGMAAYVPFSQLCTYGFLWKLMTAKSLREGQVWIGACIFACVPADTIVIVFDPTSNKSLTVIAFTLVTIIYGTILSYYVRAAADREPPKNYEVPEDESDIMDSMLNEVMDFRPPTEKLQNFDIAVDFARAFGAFTITVAALKDQLLDGQAGSFYYLTLGIVVVHSALEMVIATLTPGLDLEKYPPFLKFQIGMSLFQMFAATYIAHLAPEGELESLWDDLVYSCLFGSAAAGLSEQLERLTGDYDFDKKLGFSDE